MNERIKRISALLLALIFLIPTLSGCAGRKLYSDTSFDYFDTVCTLSAVADNEEEYHAYRDVFFSTLREYHALLDVYHSYDGVVNLRTLNESDGASLTVSQELFDFLVFSKEMHTLTNGYTNLAMGSVLRLWHEAREESLDHPESPTLPNANVLEQALLHTDVNAVLLDEQTLSVRLSDPQLSLDAGALGKGYVARILSRALLEAGCNAFLLNLGGSVVAHGTKPDGSFWLTAIKNPSEGVGVEGAIRLENASLVTSGSYHRYFMANGVRYHHIVHPSDGYPRNYALSVSVLHSDPAIADALSTALFSMTVEEGLSFSKSLSDTHVVWILADGSTVRTENFNDYVEELS